MMFPKAHLTPHSKISGSRRVVTPSWLSGSVRFFCIVLLCSCHLFLISPALLGPYSFCPLLCPLLHEMFPGISNFLEEISSLSYSVVSLYFFSLLTSEGFLISPCYSLELCIHMGISFLFSFAFHFSSLYL